MTDIAKAIQHLKTLPARNVDNYLEVTFVSLHTTQQRLFLCVAVSAGIPSLRCKWHRDTVEGCAGGGDAEIRRENGDGRCAFLTVLQEDDVDLTVSFVCCCTAD